MRPWRLVAMLSISETVAWGALYYSFGALLRPFASHFAVSEAVIAGAFSVALLGAAAAAWIAGTSIDRWGPRPVMTLSALLGVGALASLGTIDSILGFYLAWAMIGVSHAGVLYEPAFAVITKWFPAPKERGRALLVLTTVAGFASTIFVPLTASLYEHLGRQRTVLILATLVALTVVPLNAALPRRQTLVTSPAGRVIQRDTSPRVARFAIVFSLQAFASAGVTVHLLSHLREDGLDLTTAATITGLMGAAQVPARLLFDIFQRFVGARARLPLLLGLQALAFVGVLGRGHVVPLAVVVLGAANGLLTLERAVVIADAFGGDHYGAVSGRITTFANVARAAGPVTIGLVKLAASSYTLAFLGLAVITSLAAVILRTSSPIVSVGTSGAGT
jgi:MFS family permease